MRKLFTLLAVSALALTAQAQTFAYEINLKTGKGSPIFAKHLHTFSEVPVLKTVDLSGVLGAHGGTLRPLAGFMLSKSGKLAKEADWIAGATFRVAQGQTPIFGGIVLGARIRLP